MNAVMEMVLGIARDVFRAPSDTPVSEWADRNVVLTEKMAAVPGPYDSSRTPYVRMVMNFPQQDDYDEMFIGKSSQTGMTEGIFNIFRWMPTNDPGPVAYAIDAESEMRNISEIRLRPTIERLGGSALTGDADDMSLMTIKLRNMVFYFGSGGTKKLYENKFVKLFVLDEVENHKLNEGAKRNATTIGLARERRKTVPGGKLIALGKFGLHGGVLHSEWREGTRQFFEVPCAKCGHRQNLRMTGLKFGHHKDLANGWDERGVLEDTRYVCAACGFEHLWEEHQTAMVAAGEWGEPTNAKATPRVQSIQISDLYSPWESWGALALKLIKAKDNPGEKRKVYNHNFALPWREREQKVEGEEILALRGGLKDGRTGMVAGPKWRFGWEPDARVCPIPDPALCLVAVDCQDACFKFMAGVFRHTGELHVIDYGQVLSLADVEAAFLHRYPVRGVDGDFVIEPLGGLVDSGFATKQVYAFCEEMQGLGKLAFPSKGMPASATSGRLWVERSAQQFGDLKRYDYLDYQLKYEVYVNRIKRRGAPRIYFPEDIGEHHGLVGELCSERLETRAVGKRMTTEWVAHGKNDYGDCLKMLALGWDIIGTTLNG